jgi:hypothetical protein
MGYTYIAIGGMVPLNAASIHACLQAISGAISANIQVHLLGFAKAEQIKEFAKYDITSFDTTSPLIRAFKDSKANYYVMRSDGSLDYYTAIRVPQALENQRLMKSVKMGRVKQQTLMDLETTALRSLRAYDRGECSLESTVQAVVTYSKWFTWDPNKTDLENDSVTWKTRGDVERTLKDRPWISCKCPICAQLSIEVVLFRNNNRNRRRGFHNLTVFNRHVKNTVKTSSRVLEYQ